MYTTITEIPDVLLPDLENLFATEWWTKNRTTADIRKMLDNSEAVVGIVESLTGGLIGFGRAISDQIYKALIMDVIVIPNQRSRGVGKLLIDQLMSHPSLAAVKDFELYCKPEHVELYRRCGFKESPNGVLFMRATRNRTAYEE